MTDVYGAWRPVPEGPGEPGGLDEVQLAATDQVRCALMEAAEDPADFELWTRVTPTFGVDRALQGMVLVVEAVRRRAQPTGRLELLVERPQPET